MPTPLKWRFKISATAVRLFQYIRRKFISLKPVFRSPLETDRYSIENDSGDGVNTPGKREENAGKDAPLHENRLILKNYSDMPGIPFYDLNVWRKATASLPDDYVLPNPETMRTLLPMTADFYHSLFLISSDRPDLIVDDQVWKRIKANLPPRYAIPKPFFND